jgi:hypothetical protein
LKNPQICHPDANIHEKPGRRSPEGIFEGIREKELFRFFNSFPLGAFFRMTQYGFSKISIVEIFPPIGGYGGLK